MAERRKTERRTRRKGNVPPEKRGPHRRRGERRESPRIPLKIWVEGVEDEGHYTECMGNVSLRGAFVELDVPPAVGVRINMVFILPTRGEEIRAQGEVIAVASEHETPGARVKFLDLSFEQERAIARYLDQASE
ncbi:MAG: PilZ domain-containing protein [Deltaproteobacteria bacterium]|nr:PilZ domain-containing protein [Deltaproteobacteria bacterium]